jgi:hypothetical protein
MTGTPIINKPRELLTLLTLLPVMRASSRRRRPKAMRVDNGPEYISGALMK